MNLLGERNRKPRRNLSGMVKYRPIELGARLMAGRLSLEQLVMVRVHCPQHYIWRYPAP